jgi:predicted transcriptional regulator
MTIKEFSEKLGLEIATGDIGVLNIVTGGYICDLLSWVMSHAPKDGAWITVLNHINVVAVAVLTEVACIIMPEGIKPEDQTLKKAMEQGIPILCSKHDAYTLTCKMHDIL